MAFDSEMREPAHHIAREILRQGNIMKKSRRSKNFSITICWTAGHSGIPGNELADKEAKKAAAGLNSDTKSLPSTLRRKLPINPSTVKQAFSTEIKKRWKDNWRNTRRGLELIKVDKNTPSTHILHLISNLDLPRASTGLIIQLLTNHIPLNAYLYKINKVDSAHCPACGASHESVRHFIVECPIYAFERWPLERRLKRKRKELMPENALGDQELVKSLVNFIEATHWFTPSPILPQNASN